MRIHLLDRRQNKLWNIYGGLKFVLKSSLERSLASSTYYSWMMAHYTKLFLNQTVLWVDPDGKDDTQRQLSACEGSFLSISLSIEPDKMVLYLPKDVLKLQTQKQGTQTCLSR